LRSIAQLNQSVTHRPQQQIQKFAVSPTNSIGSCKHLINPIRWTQLNNLLGFRYNLEATLGFRTHPSIADEHPSSHLLQQLQNRRC
jgi:hypothetical protein